MPNSGGSVTSEERAPDGVASRRPWYRDPFVVFLGIGVLLFALDTVRGGGDATEAIHIGAAEIDRLSQLWQAQAGRPATSDELEGLVQATVREEILFREALRLGLDQDDTIIRRRLAQKMGFLLDDNSRLSAPSNEELQTWFEEHRDDYALPPRWSFRHVFYSVDRRGEDGAEQAAASDLEGLRRSSGSNEARWRSLGDPFMLQREYADRSAQDVAELFGRRFATSLASLPTSQPATWQGPVRSALGVHLVQIRAHQPARSRSFEQARAAVDEDYRRVLREQANEAAFERLRARYEVNIERAGTVLEASRAAN